MKLIDTHCHLHFKDYDNNRPEVLAAAQKAGITRMICVGTTLADSQAAIDYAYQTQNVWASAGTHPHDAETIVNFPGRALENKLSGLLDQPKVVAVGEIGLDFYKNYSSRENQKKALHLQIKIGLDKNLPFIFHIRDAWTDFWEVFDGYPNITGVVHSFSSDTKQLDEILSRNLYVGLNGIMTFTNDHAQLEAARRVPQDKLLLETDAPFLTPVPFRGSVCEPKHTLNVAEFLADLRGETLQSLAEATSSNAVRLFKLA